MNSLRDNYQKQKESLDKIKNDIDDERNSLLEKELNLMKRISQAKFDENKLESLDKELNDRQIVIEKETTYLKIREEIAKKMIELYKQQVQVSQNGCK